jgi:hypothetical protein
MAMKKFFLFTFLLVTTILTQGQSLTQTVKGTITDKISEKPLAGASVSVEGTRLTAGNC